MCPQSHEGGKNTTGHTGSLCRAVEALVAHFTLERLSGKCPPQGKQGVSGIYRAHSALK
jgi:hypothetical protein